MKSVLIQNGIYPINKIHSSVMTSASASGVVSYVYTSANKTLTMIVNTDTSPIITINFDTAPGEAIWYFDWYAVV